MLKKCLLILAFAVTGCANSGGGKVEALNNLNFPSSTSTPAPYGNQAELESLHSANKQTIASLTNEIKATRVKDLKGTEVFDSRSGIDEVFQALTRLEQFNELNDIYYKDQNKSGLAHIGEILKPITREAS